MLDFVHSLQEAHKDAHQNFEISDIPQLLMLLT
jgi:hypothetical protein